jgi:hypothetical protein
MNQSQKGNYCELLVLTRLVQEGKSIAIPYGNQSGWDLLVSENGVWKKWQVKTVRQRAASGKTMYLDFIRSADRKNGRGGAGAKGYSAGEFDYMIAVLPATGEMWKITASDCINRRCLTFHRDNYVW